ncbi:MAG: DHHA1 domain-containing protein, partial [Pseudomonadota bacterium]
DRVKTLLAERKALEAEIADLRRQIALGGGGAGPADAKDVAGMPFFAQVLPGANPKDLRGLIDEHKTRLGTAVVLLIADTDGKATVAAGVTQDLVAKVSAVDLVRAAVTAVGGKGGGGRPDMAQGGGPEADKAEAAIAAAEGVLAAV